MKERINWEDVSFVIVSSYRVKVLELLEVPTTPSKLSEATNINITHVSRALAELESKKLIECLTPDVSKGRLYRITEYGREIQKAIKEKLK